MSDTTAFDNLCAAIRDYYKTVEPTTYVESWVLINHKLSPEMEKANQSVVGVLSSPELTWVQRRGMIDIALTSDRFDPYFEDEDLDDDEDD